MWYLLFFICVLVLACHGTPRDRPAMRVVAVATMAGALLTPLWFEHIPGAVRMIGPATGEYCTLLGLLAWSPNPTGYWQAAAVGVAWLAHAQVYMDLQFNSNWIYDRYETVITAVALWQLGACHDSWGHFARLASDWLHDHFAAARGIEQAYPIAVGGAGGGDDLSRRSRLVAMAPSETPPENPNATER